MIDINTPEIAIRIRFITDDFWLEWLSKEEFGLACNLYNIGDSAMSPKVWLLEKISRELAGR